MIRLAPKLSEKHVHPPPIWGKIKVKLATQVFSHSVSSAMKTYEAVNDLPPSAKQTALFCEFMNSIFDVLNSNTQFSLSPLKTALNPSSNSHSYEFIEKAICWLQSWKICDKKGEIINHRFRFPEGLCLALRVAMLLSHELAHNYGFTYFMTRRMCTDSLEGFFCIIRSKGGFNSYPTCYGFQCAFKQAVMN